MRKVYILLYLSMVMIGLSAQKTNSTESKNSSKISKEVFEYNKELLSKKISPMESMPLKTKYLYSVQKINPGLETKIIRLLQKSSKPSIKTIGDSTIFCISYNFDTIDIESRNIFMRINNFIIENIHYIGTDNKLTRCHTYSGTNHFSIKTVSSIDKKKTGINLTGESEYLLQDAISKKINRGNAKLILMTIDSYDSVRIQKPKVNQLIKIGSYMFGIKAIRNNQIVLIPNPKIKITDVCIYSCLDSTGQFIKLEESFPRDPNPACYKKDVLNVKQALYDFISKHPDGSYEDYLNSHPNPANEKNYYLILNGFCPETKSYLMCIPHYNKTLAIDLSFRK